MSHKIHPVDIPKTPSLDPKIVYAFCRFAGAYWRGATGQQAWLLTVGLGFFLAMSTTVTVAINQWNRWFFDALEKKEVEAVWQLLFWMAGVVGVMAAVGVGIVLTREALQVRWRAWLIDRLLDRWVGNRRFYELNARGTEPANPEYRIAEDTRWATEPLTDLGIGLVIALMNAAAFISILWSVGGSYTLKLGDGSITIPAYMVLVALAYGIIMSGVMLWFGRPLPSLVYAKNEREGDFRFALMRLRENAESIALLSGHASEQRQLKGLFDHAVSAWLQIVKRHGHVTWITNASGPMIPIVPLLFAAPKYFSGDLSLGQVTQLAGAFIAVQGAISWIVDNFNRISEWYASARRVMDIVDACEEADINDLQGSQIVYRYSDATGLVLDGVGVRDPRGVEILSGIELTVRSGQSVHIAGDTSIGKTTLVRAIAGLWTRGEGTISLPAGASTMVVPQKPYMPLGSLRSVLAYPEAGDLISGGDAQRVLKETGLGHLVGVMNQTARWDQQLSNGERQRLGIARLLLKEPEVVILDDALSALDEASQIDLIKRLKSALPDAAIICLGQTHPPAGLHDQVVSIERSAGTSTLRSAEPVMAY